MSSILWIVKTFWQCWYSSYMYVLGDTRRWINVFPSFSLRLCALLEHQFCCNDSAKTVLSCYRQLWLCRNLNVITFSLWTKIILFWQACYSWLYRIQIEGLLWGWIWVSHVWCALVSKGALLLLSEVSLCQALTTMEDVQQWLAAWVGSFLFLRPGGTRLCHHPKCFPAPIYQGLHDWLEAVLSEETKSVNGTSMRSRGSCEANMSQRSNRLLCWMMFRYG